MDEGLSRAVREAFVSLYEKGLIYRAERMVDWDPVGQTVLSDLEVDREEEAGTFWYLRYPLADGSGHIVVGTTRPETMLGDTAVAVHPEDERYKDMIGKMIDLPLVGRQIPIIADEILPDPETGTGAVKVTPAHDPNDFECGERHNLERIQVIGFDAKIMDTAPAEFQGLDRYEARKLVVKRFEEAGLLEEIEERPYAPGRSERTGVIVEPLPMLQWFVKGKPLAEPALKAVEDGETRLIPPVWKKTYDHFLNNIREWCISRQLWWGHQIPAWYCGDCDEIVVARQTPERCTKCESENLTQDEDVLDTWFSSALWPFSTLGWPEKTPDLAKFYPTQVMETGFDILFFWVARMMMMGLHFMDEVPFEEVFLHAMVRDAQGRKMSKTVGNVIDPLHMIFGAKAEDLDPEEHAELLRQYPEGVEPQGADALRFTLAVYAAQGRDIKLDIKRIEGYRSFLNKLWNASKFALMNLDGFEAPAYASFSKAWESEEDWPFERGALSTADQWILARLDETVGRVTGALEEFRFNDAAQTLYHFTWHELCDWYIELIKPTLYDTSQENEGKRRATQCTLLYALETVLRLLHPTTPYVTEEIWQALPRAADAPKSIMIAPWPLRRPDLAMDQARESMETLIELITAIRTIRGETNVKPGVTIDEVYFAPASTRVRQAIEGGAPYIERMARVAKIQIVDAEGLEALGTSATSVVGGTEIRIPLAGLIDIAEEKERIKKELERVEEDIAFVSRKLSNEKFVQRAPEQIVAKEREKLALYEEELATLQKSLAEVEALESS